MNQDVPLCLSRMPRVYPPRAVEASSWTTLDVHNEDPTPVIWTKTADEILASIGLTRG